MRYNPSQIRLLRCSEPGSDEAAGPSPVLDTPDSVRNFWHSHIAKAPEFTTEQEMFVVIHLSTRRHCMGFVISSIGTLDSVTVHPREVFRAAIVNNASAILVCHNHPSGDPTPSTADIRTTQDLIRAGQLLRIELLDHVIIGAPSTDRIRDFVSLKENGHFYS